MFPGLILPFLCRMMIIRLLFFCVLLPCVVTGQTKVSVKEYIDKYKEIAITEMNRYGIPASIKLGQGLLESSSGNSDLATEANNHFGIKCKKEWTGPTFFKDDDEKQECFRKYPRVLDSYEDHSRFLKNSVRYAELFKLELIDYKGWAYGLKKAGYATNPQYPQLLIKTIEENRLYEFDKPGISPEFQQPKPEKKAEPVAIKPGKKPGGNDIPDFEMKRLPAREILHRNKVEYFLVKEGDTYEKLTKEMDLMIWQIYKYNDLPKTAIARPGDIIYIKPKRRKAAIATHQVKQGETLRSISQEYAIKMKRICDLNNLEETGILKTGTTLKLR
jgi:LysM repeat protein